MEHNTALLNDLRGLAAKMWTDSAVFYDLGDARACELAKEYARDLERALAAPQRDNLTVRFSEADVLAARAALAAPTEAVPVFDHNGDAVGAERPDDALAVLAEFHADGERGDLEGGWLQDTAVETGVMIRHSRTTPCAERCACADFVGNDEPVLCIPIRDDVFALMKERAP